MFSSIEEINYDLVWTYHTLEEIRFLKILINCRTISSVVELLKKYKIHNYLYVSCDNSLIKIDVIINYLDEMSRNKKNYYDILNNLSSSLTYSSYIAEC